MGKRLALREVTEEEPQGLLEPGPAEVARPLPQPLSRCGERGEQSEGEGRSVGRGG